MRVRFLNIAYFALPLILLGGCVATMMSGAYVSMFRNDVNIRQTNQAAADYLTQYMREFVDDGDLVQVQSLQDTDQPALNAEIGSIIAHQVGERLHDLGYNVDLGLVPVTANNDIYPPAAIPYGQRPEFVLSGTYMTRARDVDVRLRVVEVHSGQVRAAFDYKLPLNRELRQKTERPTKIQRLPSDI